MDRNLDEIKEKVLPLLKKAGVLKSSIFGSVARGENLPDSDIDILVEFPEGKNMFDLIDLEQQLQLILGKKIDIVTYRSVHHLLRESIFREQIRIL